MLRLGAPRQGMARRVLLRSGKVRQGWAGHGKARQGLTCQADGTASKAKVCPGTVRHGVDKAVFEMAWPWQGWAWNGWLRFGRASYVMSGHGRVGSGGVWRALGTQWSGEQRRGEVCSALQRRGLAGPRQGEAGSGVLWQRCGAVWLGQAVPGWARHALARRGVERPGRARIKQYLKVVRRAQER